MGTLLAAAATTLVFCAPGYPGETGDAQPYVDQFAQAAAAAAGWPAGSLAAVYDPTEAGGLAKLASPDAGLAFVPYPFFVEHAAQLHLAALVQADVTDTGPRQRWTLIAKRGRVSGPASLSGLTIVSTAGYAPEFLAHSALQAWPLPGDVRIEPTGQVLSALRRVAAGEPVVVLLDQTQAAALASLPFASELQAVVQSPELPVAVLAVVASRVGAARTQALRSGLLRLGHDPGSAELLASMRLRGFVPPELPGHTAAP
jgi:ABC transporter, phosphonate, periplasmic substrate-binding protein